jgi:thymidylate kinase
MLNGQHELILFEGLKGTGQSHFLLLIYHLLQKRGAGREWFKKHGIGSRLRESHRPSLIGPTNHAC